MKSLASHLYLITLHLWVSTSFVLPVVARAAEVSNLDREVEIEFNPVDGAISYEIKAQNKAEASTNPIIFVSPTSSITKRLPLGTWIIEVRSIDRRRVPGRWQSIGELNIGFKTPQISYPKDKIVLKTNPGEVLPVEFKWSSFHPKAEYLLTIENDDHTAIDVKQVVTGESVIIPLKTGRYSWSLTSNPPVGIEKDGKDPEPSTFQISAGKLESPVIETNKKKNPRVINWTLPNHATESLIKVEFKNNKINTDQDNTASRTVFSERSQSTSWDVPEDLSDGIYKFSIIATADGFEPSTETSFSFQIKRKKDPKKSQPKIRKKKISDPESVYAPVDFMQASIGAALWNYSFNSTSGQKFSLVSGTLTAIDGDFTKWILKSKTSAWGVEIRGRQTNIYLFEDGTTKPAGQEPVLVSDRRMAIMARKRSIRSNFGFDAILGLGTHKYTYLIQEQISSLIAPISGQLLEIYLGGSVDWQLENRNHVTLDLTFHPVGNSIGISADQTWQYTATARYLKQALHEKSFLTINLENFRSRVTTHSSKFAGSAETVSTWYRLGLGLAIKL